MLRRRAHRYRDEVATRARQQAAVAELGQRALAGLELDELIQAAVDSTARELGTDYVSVLEVTGEQTASGRSGGRPAALYRFASPSLEVTDPFAVFRPPSSRAAGQH